MALAAVPAMAQGSAEDFVYILPSKEIAETGEDLFFKAYLMDRQTLALSGRSQTLYLEIRSERDSLVWSEKYPIVDGRGDGHVYIGENWQQGEYFLEGYTSSSFTSDTTEALRPRRLRVVDRVNQMEAVTEQAIRQDSLLRATGKHRFDLFPEGGDLIDGVTSVVAFKATYGGGFPEDVAGQVLEDGRPVADIRCLHDGMGQFVLTPHSGKSYQVLLDDGRTFPLPAVKPDGLAMRVARNNATGIDILISAPGGDPRPFSILAKLHGIACSGAQGTVAGQQLVRLPKELFPQQGIVELTLADGDGRPVAERLVFVNPQQRLTVTAEPDRERYGLREQGKVRVQVTDADGNPVRAELAVSIFDKAYLYQPGHENILSHAYLSEQIRGDIFNPTYYFDERNADRLQALDLLLMTQGWRRYVWDNPATGQERRVLQDGISGRDRVERLQFVQAISPQGDTCLVMSDSLGRFEIDPDQMFVMPGNVYLKPMVDRPKPKLVIVNPFDSIDVHRQGRARYQVQDYVFTEEEEEPFYYDPGVTVLADAVVKARHKSPVRDKVTGYLDSLAIMSAGAWVCECDAEGDEGFLNDFHGYSHHPEGTPMDMDYRAMGGKRLLPKRGHHYSMVKIEYFERELGGHWVITDRVQNYEYIGPDLSEEALLEIYGMWKAQGYYPRREFYQPDELDLAAPTPDYRNLLQWQPAVITNENGIAEIPFAASDVNTEFVGLVEAIDGTGLLGAQLFSFRVLKQ